MGLVLAQIHSGRVSVLHGSPLERVRVAESAVLRVRVGGVWYGPYIQIREYQWHFVLDWNNEGFRE